MQVHRTIEELPFFNNPVITIGTFDGVHLGHQKIIAALKDQARKINGETVIITFDPHPRKVVNAAQSMQLINTLNEKIHLLNALDIDHLVVVPFTKAFAEQTADDYIKNFLIDKFHPHTIIIGYDHRFGKSREGDLLLLEKESRIFSYELHEIPKYVIDEISISSTNIRKALLNSNIETANKLLGYDFFFEGLVVNGDKLGRTLGYPTANLEYQNLDKIRLGHGVYAVYADIEGNREKGMLSIGDRPTLDKEPAEKVEVNVFDFDQDIYGQQVKVTVKKFLRPQVKYASLEELIQQLAIDKENSLRFL